VLTEWQAERGFGTPLSITTCFLNPDRGFTFPPGKIEHAASLYHYFGRSLGDVKSILAAWGVAVLYESNPRPDRGCSQLLADMLKWRRPKPEGKNRSMSS
jgi:transposase-like protein